MQQTKVRHGRLVLVEGAGALNVANAGLQHRRTEVPRQLDRVDERQASELVGWAHLPVTAIGRSGKAANKLRLMTRPLHLGPLCSAAVYALKGQKTSMTIMADVWTDDEEEEFWLFGYGYELWARHLRLNSAANHDLTVT